MGRKTLALLLLRPRVWLAGGDMESRERGSTWSSSETYGRMLERWKLVPELDIDADPQCRVASPSILPLGMETRTVCGGTWAGFVTVVGGIWGWVAAAAEEDDEREVSLSMQRGLWTRDAMAVSPAGSREVTRDG